MIFVEKTRGLLTCAMPKGTMPPNFVEKTFANSHKTAKFAKVFSLKVSRYTVIRRLQNTILDPECPRLKFLGLFNNFFSLSKFIARQEEAYHQSIVMV